MKNNLFSTSMVVLPIISAVQPIWAQKVSNKPLNIVCIFTDDHAFQTISAYGHPISKLAPTPNIDRLAGNGMLFTQSFVENSISGGVLSKCSHVNQFIINHLPLGIY